MHLEIITPDKKVYDGDCSSVIVPGSSGQLQFLNNHAPLVSALSKGTLKIKDTAGEKKFEISGGVVEVLKNRVIVLAEKILE